MCLYDFLSEQIKNCTALLFSDDDLSVEPIKLFPDPKEQRKNANSSPTSFLGTIINYFKLKPLHAD